MSFFDTKLFVVVKHSHCLSSQHSTGKYPSINDESHSPPFPRLLLNAANISLQSKSKSKLLSTVLSIAAICISQNYFRVRHDAEEWMDVISIALSDSFANSRHSEANKIDDTICIHSIHDSGTEESKTIIKSIVRVAAALTKHGDENLFRSTSGAKELFKRPGWHSNVNRLIEYVIIKVINDSMYNHWEDEELIDSLLLLLVNTMSQLQRDETQFECSRTVVQTEKQECSESVPDLVSALIKKVLIDNKSTEIRISLALKTIASIVNTAPKVGFPHTRRRTQYMKSLATVRLFDIICSRIHSTDKKLSGKMSDENVILSWHVLALLGECMECIPDSRRKKSKDCNPIVENSNSSFSKIVKMILVRWNDKDEIVRM